MPDPNHPSSVAAAWITMSLAARNLAFNNVAHAGAEFVQKKNEGWLATSTALRTKRSQHLDLPYGTKERTK